jgi:hypothetical protein
LTASDKFNAGGSRPPVERELSDFSSSIIFLRAGKHGQS